MTPGELASIGVLYVVYTLSILLIGMYFGAILTAAHVTRLLNRAAPKLLPPPPLEGDEWKDGDKKKKDDDWLRRHLGE